MLASIPSKWNLYVAGRNANDSATLENSWQFLIKLNTCLSYHPLIPVLNIYPEKLKHISIQKSIHGYQLTLIRMATIKKKKPENNKCWWECEKLEPLGAVGERKSVIVAVKSSLAAPQGSQNRIATWSSNSISCIYPKDLEAGPWKEICTPIFLAASFTICGSSPSVHPCMNGSAKCGRHVQYLFSLKD